MCLIVGFWFWWMVVYVLTPHVLSEWMVEVCGKYLCGVVLFVWCFRFRFRGGVDVWSYIVLLYLIYYYYYILYITIIILYTILYYTLLFFSSSDLFLPIQSSSLLLLFHPLLLPILISSSSTSFKYSVFSVNQVIILNNCESSIS